MLEKKLILDCNLLAKEDLLEITTTNHQDQRTLQYLSLIEAFSANFLKQETQDLEISILSGPDTATTLLNSEHLRATLTDHQGIEETTLKYEDQHTETIEKLEKLYQAMERLNSPTKQRIPQVPMFAGKPLTFKSKYTFIELYETPSNYFIFFLARYPKKTCEVSYKFPK